MIQVLVKTINYTLSILIILSLIVVFFLATTPGLICVIQLSRFYIPGTLKIQQIKGSLIHDFTLSELEYQNKSTKLNIKQLNVQWIPHSLKKNQQLNAQWHIVQWGNGHDKIIESKEGTLIATGILPNLSIDLNAKINTALNDHGVLYTKIRGTLPWQWAFNAKLTQPDTSPAQHTPLSTNLSITGEITAKNQGNVLLTINQGFYHIPNQDTLPVFHFKGGTVNLILSPKQLTGSGILNIDEHKNLNLAFQLPKFTLDTGVPDNQLIDGKLSLTVNSFDFLQKISPTIETLQGQMMLSLSIHGTMKEKQIRSQFILNKTSVSLPKLGLNIDNLELDIRGKEKSWETAGSITSSGHKLALSGKGVWTGQLLGDISLEGIDFPIINTSEYQIHISPNLNLHITPTAHDLSGTILIPYATVKPRTIKNSISLPEDVVYKRKEASASFATFLSKIDIALEMGKNVAVNIKGLKGFLDGILHAKQLQTGSMNAYGELSVREGTYKAYGQELIIKKGQLIFTGGPINNPGIHVRAIKKISTAPSMSSNSNQILDFNNTNLQNINYGESIILGVEATGRLTQPKIQLFSEPAILSQADILSMLVLGRPINQVNKAGGQSLLTAISTMGLNSSTENLRLLQQLKQNVGIDFNVQTNTNYNQMTNTTNDTTSFMIGKSLSKRLYLSYSIGLSQTDTNMLTLKYLLNKFFSIQISNSDTSSAIDFLYTSHKKNTPNIKK